MAMSPKCSAEVLAAAGRPLTESKLNAIADALDAKMRELARRDRKAWQALTREQRMTQAAAEAMADLQTQAALKEYRASLQVLRAAESDGRIAAAMEINGLTRSQGLVRDIEQTHNYGAAVRDEAITGLRDVMDAAASKDGTGVVRRGLMAIFDVDNPGMTADIVREVFKLGDGSTGNKAAQAAAKAWLETIEGMRQRFNAAGGNVGKLGYGYLSQAHDAVRVMEAGPQAWAAKVLPLLDREQYVKADGSLMSDAELTQMLTAAHATVASGGASKVEPGQFKGTGARANAGSEARVIHFRDGEAWMNYMAEFGQGSLYDAMLGHVGGMARDIALVERHGPNPEQWFKVQNDIAERADGRGTMANRAALNTPQAYWDIATGKTGSPESRVIAQIGADVRNVQTAAKLGGAVLSSLTDVATIASTLHFNRLPYFDMLGNLGRRLKPGSEERDFLQAHGVMAESLASTMNRWTGDNMTHSLTGRVASSVMKLSLMNAWTDGLRGAFAATMMQGFTRKLGKAWGELDEWDRYLMQRKGIGEADWAVISKAEPVERNGRQYLTADAVRAVGDDGAQAATKWLAFVSDEAQFAVINPDMATRAIATGGGMPAGTVKGEAMRSFAQFKSFPVAMMTRHWRRIFETPQGLEGAPTGFGAESATGARVNQLAGFAALNVTGMLLGAIVLQEKSLVSGKDPLDMTTGKFWGKALAQGGGLGYVGDFLLKDPTEQRPTTAEQIGGVAFGPAGGAVAGLAGDVLWTNAWQAAKGKEANFAAEATRWGNAQLPYVGLWQTRAAWEHLVLHNLQEAANPGYLARMQRRAQKDWGQAYWWEPGEALPDRAPDFGATLGQ